MQFAHNYAWSRDERMALLTPVPCSLTRLFSEASCVQRPLAVLGPSSAERRARGNSGSTRVQTIGVIVENLSTI